MILEKFVLEKDVEHIKIHGLQRSGTNYLAMLVNENFEKVKCLINSGGWKHGHYCAPWVLGQEVHVLTIIKNPYAWLVSLYKYWGPNNKYKVGPNLEGVSFDEFLRNKTEFERQGSIPFLYRAANPIQFWNDMNFHWMSIRINEKKSLAFQYELLLENSEFVIDSLGKELRINKKNKFIDTDFQFEPGQEEPKMNTQIKSDKDYYLSKKYMDLYSHDLLQFVNSQLDKQVMASIGYDFVN